MAVDWLTIGSALLKGGAAANDSGPNVSGGSTVISGGIGDGADLARILNAKGQAPFWAWGGTDSSTPGWFGGAPIGGVGVGGGGLLLLAGGLLLAVLVFKKRGG